jgi:tetratricopeptide (TPR) repeat protein
LQQLGKLSPQELEQIEETRLTDGLIHCLQRRRFLLVLDNLESVLQDEAYRDFLQRWVGDCHHTEILVTTQIPPNLVQDKPTELPLPGLSAGEGAQLLRELGVGGTAEELEGFVAQVNGHPLTLRLVAGLLNGELGDGATIGDLAELGIADVGALMSRLQGYHRREMVQLVAVLDASFNRLSETWRKVLLSLVVFRQAFNAEVASAMLGEAVAEKELRGLAKRGFLVAEAGGYTFQPLILDYLKFRVGDLREGHLRAIAFYQSRFKSRPEWQTVEDVREYLEVFYHRCELGEYEAAFDVIRQGDKVDEFLDLRGKNQLRVELYQQLIDNLPNWQDWRYTASLTSLGNAYYSLGRYSEAIAFYEQSLEIARQIGHRQGEAASLGSLGNAYDSLGRYSEAIAFYEQSLEIFREISYRWGEATSLGNLGNAYDSLGRYSEAIAFYEQSLEIQRQIGNRRGESDSLNGLGSAYHSLGRYSEAITFYGQSLEIQRQIGNRRGEADSLNGLGSAYHSLEHYSEAITFLEQSLEIFREISQRRGEATSLGNLGNAYNSLGRYSEAIAFYEQSLEIKREIGDRRGEADSLNGLGNVYHSLGGYRKGISCYEQALEIAREIGNIRGEANSLNGLGNAYHCLGCYSEAIASYEQLLAIKREIGDRRGEANTLLTLGNVYQKVGRIQEGFVASHQGTLIYQELDLPLEAYPYPNWMKKIAKFAQRSKFHLIVCFMGGVVAFPFALIWFVSITLYRLIRPRFNRR